MSEFKITVIRNFIKDIGSFARSNEDLINNKISSIFLKNQDAHKKVIERYYPANLYYYYRGIDHSDKNKKNADWVRAAVRYQVEIDILKAINPYLQPSISVEESLSPDQATKVISLLLIHIKVALLSGVVVQDETPIYKRDFGKEFKIPMRDVTQSPQILEFRFSQISDKWMHDFFDGGYFSNFFFAYFKKYFLLTTLSNLFANRAELIEYLHNHARIFVTGRSSRSFEMEMGEILGGWINETLAQFNSQTSIVDVPRSGDATDSDDSRTILAREDEVVTGNSVNTPLGVNEIKINAERPISGHDDEMPYLDESKIASTQEKLTIRAEIKRRFSHNEIVASLDSVAEYLEKKIPEIASFEFSDISIITKFSDYLIKNFLEIEALLDGYYINNKTGFEREEFIYIVAPLLLRSTFPIVDLEISRLVLKKYPFNSSANILLIFAADQMSFKPDANNSEWMFSS